MADSTTSTTKQQTNLKQLMEELSWLLEDEPDQWFSNPRGIVKKPDYKRAAQEKSSILKKTSYSTFLSSGYQSRFFILDIKTHTLHYGKTEEMQTNSEKGTIDMSKVVDITYSQVFDAPNLSIDLITTDRHYTMAFDSHTQMVRWAFACSLACSARISRRLNDIQIDIPPNDPLLVRAQEEGTATSMTATQRWSEFEVVFTTPAPMLLNVTGIVNKDKDGRIINYLLGVTSFDFQPNGKTGIAETTGVIAVKDYLVAVNDTNLTNIPTAEALLALSQSSWPRHLTFLRDQIGARDGPRVEGWAKVYYPALHKPRYRYVELIFDKLFFYKAEPGGMETSYKEASFTFLHQVKQILPTASKKEVPSGYGYILQMQCKPDSFVRLFRGQNESCIGATRTDVVELHFKNIHQLNRWRSALVSPVMWTDGQVYRLTSESIQTIGK